METETVDNMDSRHKPRVFYGWWIVLVTFLGDMMMGATAYTFPIFYKPMAEALNLSRTTVALAPTIRTFIGAALSPLIGWLVDNRGPRAIMVVGAILLGFTSLAMGLVNHAWQYFLVYSVLGGLATVARGPLLTQVTVAKWFVKKRGRAMSIVSMGVSVSGVIFTPVGTYMVLEHGWRSGWVVLGLMTWIVLIVPTAIIMRRQPEDMGLLPDGLDPISINEDSQLGENASQSRGTPDTDIEPVWTLQEAIASRTFWLIILSFSMGTMSISAIVLHQFNYITDKGFSEATAASVVTFYAFNAIIAKLIYGYISERVHIRYLVIVCFVGGGIGIALLNVATTTAGLFTYAFVYGLTRGAFVLVTPLAWANYFGRTFLGTIRGFASPFNMISSAGGPLFAAWLYDTTESYSLAFSIFSFTFVLGAFFMFLAKPPKPNSTGA